VCSPGKKNEARKVKIMAAKQRIPRIDEKYHIAGLLA
jgi:hypothetical protein